MSEAEHKKVLFGQVFENKSLQNNGLIILVYGGNISAVAENNNGIIKVKKVFL